MLWLYWDPSPEVFRVPFFEWPVFWYGLLFMLGFAIGFPIFSSILYRYLQLFPAFSEKEIYTFPLFSPNLDPRLNGELKEAKSKAELVEILNRWCIVIGRNTLEKAFGPKYLMPLRKKATLITDKLTAYMVIATIIGARLGHFFFYERPSEYLAHPEVLFELSEGGLKGLSSHGAAIAIILALILFHFRVRKWSRDLDWVRILDFVCIPTALAGALIRVGNFINQEILGSPTNLPWAIIYGHPIDRSFPVPRHPVQLYEALFYFLVFLLLWAQSYRSALLKRGHLIGLFLILVFVFRFFVEFLKPEQSLLLSPFSWLNMGQILSLPLIAAGILLLVIPKVYRKHSLKRQ